MRGFIATFVAGLLALLPLIVTLLVVSFLVGKLNALLGPGSSFGRVISALTEAFGIPSSSILYAITLAAAIALIWLCGHFARRYTGERIHEAVGSLLGRVPVISKIYSSTDQMVTMLSQRHGDSVATLSNVVMARIGNAHVLGMLSSPQTIDIGGVPHHIVFIPATPIPASGQNVLVPVSDVTELKVSVEELTKIILSLGSLAPMVLEGKVGAPPAAVQARN